MTKPMPTINIAAIELKGEERTIIDRILNKGRLRATKPQTKDSIGGEAAYVWRMVAFDVSPNSKHHCMPVLADFDLHTDDWDNRRAVCEHLDHLVKRIVDSVPKTQWHGILRWGQAFGMIGQPMHSEEGAVIYR